MKNILLDGFKRVNGLSMMMERQRNFYIKLVFLIIMILLIIGFKKKMVLKSRFNNTYKDIKITTL